MCDVCLCMHTNIMRFVCVCTRTHIHTHSLSLRLAAATETSGTPRVDILAMDHDARHHRGICHELGPAIPSPRWLHCRQRYAIVSRSLLILNRSLSRSLLTLVSNRAARAARRIQRRHGHHVLPPFDARWRDGHQPHVC